MKARKMLAATLAVATMTSMMSMPVLADTIEGGTVYIDQDVYNVVLPTTASMKFYLDPQGLTTLGSDGTAGASKGTIVGASLDMHAINKSNAPVALSASYTLEAKKKDNTAATGITVVEALADDTAITALKNSTDKKVAVSVAAATDATTYSGKVWKATAATTDISSAGTVMSAADTVYAKQTSPDEVKYIMDKATYTAKMKDGATDKYDPNSYEMEYTANTGTDLKLTIGGYCSEKADWSSYAKGDEKLILSAVFGFKKVDSSTDTAATIGSDVEVVPEVTPDQDVTVTFSEDITATNTVITPPEGTVYSVTQSDIDSGQVVGVNGKSLTVKTFALSIWEHTAGYGKGTYTVTLTKTDGTKENKTFVLK